MSLFPAIILYIDPFFKKLDNILRDKTVLVNGVAYTTLAYADDVAIFTNDVSTALPMVYDAARQFGGISGYRLNPDKTEILHSDFQKPMGIQTTPVATYLGVKITASVGEIPGINAMPIIKEINQSLERMDHLHLSLFGRSNVIKMLILPKFLYLFQAIPVEFPKQCIASAERACLRFLWGYHIPRRASKWLILPQSRGGWGVPTLLLYHWAALLQHMGLLLFGRKTLIPEWARPSIFELLLGEAAHSCLVRNVEPSCFKKVKFKIIHSAFSIWKKIHKRFGIPIINAYTPLVSYGILPSIFYDSISVKLGTFGIFYLGDFFLGGHMVSFSDLQDMYGLPTSYFFKFLQIRSYLSKCTNGGLGQFESIPLVGLIGKRSRIGPIYQTLIAGLPDDLMAQNDRWDKKFGQMGTDLTSSLDLAGWVLISGSLRSQSYKAAFDLYFTPEKITKWSSHRGTCCSRCGTWAADAIHMFFSCPELANYIKEVERFLVQITGKTLVLTPVMVILGTDQSQILDVHDKFEWGFLFIAMSVFRACIMAQWISPDSPTFINWRTRLLAIYNIEIAVYRVRGRKNGKWV